MEVPGYPIRKIEKPAQKIEQNEDVPVVDFIRHGETLYKQRKSSQKEQMLDTQMPGFALDNEHLDLTDKGIADIRLSAQQLPIDPEKEVVLIVSSPDWRTQSSALVLDDELRARFGKVSERIILNKKDPETGLTQFKFFTEIGSQDTQYNNLTKQGLSGVIEKTGSHSKDLQPRSFQRFLRHMNNIDSWLTPETKSAIKGRRLRIVCMTHEEVPFNFMADVLKDFPAYQYKTLEKGQILEIKPNTKLTAEDSTLTSVKAFPTERRPMEAETVIERGFSPEAVKEFNLQVKAEEREREKRWKPSFALDMWDYKRGDGLVYDLMKRWVAKEQDKDRSGGRANELMSRLEEAYYGGGGKAFGLVVGEIISSNFGAMPYTIKVPKWEIVKDAYKFKIKEYNNRPYMLRSSEKTEDWINPKSGVGMSFDLYSYFSNNTSETFFQLKKEKEILKGPYVLQERIEGLGIVVDIGYSKVLGKPVVKIASGNMRGDYALRSAGHPTSATDDMEASVGVWEASNGHPVLPTVNFGHESLFKDKLEFVNTLVKPLFQAVEKSGISFGVQLELVINKNNPYNISLVQVRPTPEQVFRTIVSSGQEDKERKGSLITRSSVVNGAFDVTGEAVFFGEKGLDHNSELGNSFKKSEALDATLREASGKIGIYNETRGDVNDYLGYAKAHRVYLGGYLSGSDVQLTPRPIKPNSHHGAVSSGHRSEEFYSQLDQKCGMVHIDQEDIEKIKKLSEGKTIKLRVVSDGLIAEVYLMED